jgi:preprotein translocase subunit YajC
LTPLHFIAQPSTPSAPGPATQPVQQPWWTQPFIPIILIIAIFYVFLWRSKRTEDRKRTDMLGQLKRGDRVQTIGGILGNVVDVKDSEVTLKVDETSNTKIRFSRSAIHRVLAEDEKKS